MIMQVIIILTTWDTKVGIQNSEPGYLQFFVPHHLPGGQSVVCWGICPWSLGWWATGLWTSTVSGVVSDAVDRPVETIPVCNFNLKKNFKCLKNVS